MALLLLAFMCLRSDLSFICADFDCQNANVRDENYGAEASLRGQDLEVVLQGFGHGDEKRRVYPCRTESGSMSR